MNELFKANAAKILACYGVDSNELEKGGEGSRGGQVIGHTKSGKAIYKNRDANHPGYAKFTEEDHDDAASIHSDKAFHHEDKAGEHEYKADENEGNTKWNHHMTQADKHKAKSDYHDKVSTSHLEKVTNKKEDKGDSKKEKEQMSEEERSNFGHVVSSSGKKIYNVPSHDEMTNTKDYDVNYHNEAKEHHKWKSDHALFEAEYDKRYRDKHEKDSPEWKRADKDYQEKLDRGNKSLAYSIEHGKTAEKMKK